jgi:4-amino-4-deoxy-L-arabinose transferase-like glycosyltransferase
MKNVVEEEAVSWSTITFRSMKLLLIGFGIDLIFLLLFIVLHTALPNPLLLLPLPYFASALFLFSISALLAGFVHVYLSHPSLRWPLFFISVVTIAVLVAHFFIITEPTGNQIMDEQYYVPAARAILDGTICKPFAPNCNMEHPFLSKAFIASGMAVFGDNAFGWRLLSVILGTSCLPLFFALAWKLSTNKKLAYYATLFLAFDTMFFVNSSAALTDIFILFFAIAAFVVYFYNLKLWRFDRYFLSGALLGLSILSKETAIFVVAALLTFHLVLGNGSIKSRLFSCAKIGLVSVLIFCAGLQVYDSLLTGGQVPTFISHIQFMLSYGSSLTCPPFNCPGAFHDANGATITPLNWLLYYTPTTYFGSSVRVCSGSSCQSYSTLAYYGTTNMVETWSTFVWAPIAAWVFYRLIRKKRESTTLEQFGFSTTAKITYQESELASFALIVFCWNYFPYILLFLAGRVTYPFYFLVAVPSVALGAGYLITRQGVPRIVAIALVVAAFAWFFVYFPDKSFLPTSIRAFLGT